MLRHGGVPEVEKLGKLADRVLAVDELADDQEPVPVGQRLQEVARLVGGLLHDFAIYFHTCVYTQ